VTVSPRARRLHDTALVLDAHVHPSLKTHLFRKKLHKRHRSGGAFNPFTLRVDLPKTTAGGVDGFVASHYLPERGLIEDCRPLRWLSRIAPKRIRRLFTGDPFERTLEILEGFETAVDRANARGAELARVVRSTDEIRQARSDGVIAVVHEVEGAHSLAGRVENVEALASLGVCMLTLAHFYANEVAAPVVGIPPDMQKLGCFKAPKDLEVGGVDTVAVGSDFDGFTDPPDDLEDISQMPRLTDALLRVGFGETEIEKILGGNVMRVLRDGWR
jgi:microsomal dipeptidase-like Zn-dependent dipeptidase